MICCDTCSWNFVTTPATHHCVACNNNSCDECTKAHLIAYPDAEMVKIPKESDAKTQDKS